jgi:hypothetical protein
MPSAMPMSISKREVQNAFGQVFVCACAVGSNGGSGSECGKRGCWSTKSQKAKSNIENRAITFKRGCELADYAR